MCIIRLLIFISIIYVDFTSVTNNEMLIFVIEIKIKICVNELLNENILKRSLIFVENVLTKFF